MEIKVVNPSRKELEDMNYKEWPIWEKEVSVFDWHYNEKEVCYLLEGKVIVETDKGKVEFGAGDLVTFPAGLDCKWKILEDVKKHYKLG